MTFQFDKLTIKAQEAVAQAQSTAQANGNPEITPLHLLDSLLAESDGVVRALLEKVGTPVNQLTGTVKSEIDRFPKTSGGSQPGLNAELSNVLNKAAEQATTMQDEFVSTEHLLIALANTDSAAQRLLKLNAVTEKDILDALKTVRGSSRVTDQNPEDK